MNTRREPPEANTSTFTNTTTMRMPLCLLAIYSAIATVARADLGPLEQMEKETFAKMREVERYQLKAAEKHYLSGDFEAALNEYEKFLSLYEKSPAAPYAQLMWSHSQVRLRKANSAIKDGFQSVIDYWPDSREAILAAYLIGRTQQDMGEVEKAEKTYASILTKHPEHITALLSRQGLLKMARDRKDEKRAVEILRELISKTPSNEQTKRSISDAARELAGHEFRQGNFDAGAKWISPYFQGADLTTQIAELAGTAAVSRLSAKETAESGRKMAEAVRLLLEKEVPSELGDDKAKALARDRLLRLAALQAGLGNPKEEFACLERLGKLLGEDDGLLGKMAAWHKEQKQREKARAIYGRFADKIAGQQEIAKMMREDGKLEEAIAIYRNLMTADAAHADDHQWQIGECYEALQRLDLAIQTYRQCENFPTNYFRMAQCHRKLKQHSEALALYHQIKANTEAAAEAYLQIGYTQEEAGDKQKAISAFQQTCKLHPKSGQASEAHAHLQSAYNITITLGGAEEK